MNCFSRKAFWMKLIFYQKYYTQGILESYDTKMRYEKWMTLRDLVKKPIFLKLNWEPMDIVK